MNAAFNSIWDLLHSAILPGLWRASWQASILALIVLAIQTLLHNRIGGRGRYALWALVLIRLLLPGLPESRLSLFNLAGPSGEPAHRTVTMTSKTSRLMPLAVR